MLIDYKKGPSREKLDNQIESKQLSSDEYEERGGHNITNNRTQMPQKAIKRQ